MSNLKCLGVILDNRLTFNSHIDMLSSRLFGVLRRINSVNLFLPLHVRIRISWALLMSHILYGFEVYSGTCAVHMRKINYLINVVVRFVYNICRREIISQQFIRFFGYTFKYLVTYRNLLFFYRVIRNCKPVTLYRNFVFSRSTRNPQICLPRINS